MNAFSRTGLTNRRNEQNLSNMNYDISLYSQTKDLILYGLWSDSPSTQIIAKLTFYNMHMMH